MKKTNNTINTQNNAKATSKDIVSYAIAGYQDLLNDTAEVVEAKEALTKEKVILEKRIDILHDRLAKVAENFLTEQVQAVIYETHQQEDFREAIEATWS